MESINVTSVLLPFAIRNAGCFCPMCAANTFLYNLFIIMGQISLGKAAAETLVETLSTSNVLKYVMV